MIEAIATLVTTLLVAGGLTILSLEGWCWLHKYRWFRRLRGGHWEHHWVRAPIGGFHWLDVETCSRTPAPGLDPYDWRHAAHDVITRPALTHGPFLCEDAGDGFGLFARRAD